MALPTFFPLSPPPTPPVISSAIALSPQPANANGAFLGYGLVSPLRRDLKQDFANAGGEMLIRSCVAQILGTQCAADGQNVEAQGELPWRPSFGSIVYKLKHRKGPALQHLARIYIADALAKWEPRVAISSTLVSFDQTNSSLNIDLVYSVIDRNVSGNNVLLADVRQTVSLPLAA